eukprot:TRINITY_DN7762_c0_g1_i1.p1 TRINITY_DN7762_c0_g1~~TRINITY_DN7762_c0_g1_i1.p1  ORF type:complete len:343 (+),score=15.76 TRINITY_DN7762_c0_g1_i1:576-1604(+)
MHTLHDKKRQDIIIWTYFIVLLLSVHVEAQGQCQEISLHSAHVSVINFSGYVKPKPTQLYHYIEGIFSVYPPVAYKPEHQNCIQISDLDPLKTSVLQRTLVHLIFKYSGCSKVYLYFTKDTRIFRTESISLEGKVYLMSQRGKGLECFNLTQSTYLVQRRTKNPLLPPKFWFSKENWMNFKMVVEHECEFQTNYDTNMPNKTVLLNRDLTRKIDTSDCHSPEMDEITVHDTHEACYFAKIFKFNKRVVFPHGYFGTLLILLYEYNQVLELFPCHFHVSLFDQISTFSPYTHSQKNCTCYNEDIYRKSLGITFKDCILVYNCRDFFRNQNMKLICNDHENYSC